MSKPLTTKDLIEILSAYPENTPVFDGRGFDMHASQISERKYDDWEHATREADGEVPAIGIGIAIGRRY